MANLQEIIDNAGLDDAAKDKLIQAFEEMFRANIVAAPGIQIEIDTVGLFQLEVGPMLLETYLLNAARLGYFAVARFVLTQAERVESPLHSYGHLTLDCAARNHHENILQLLMKNGANIDAGDINGNSILYKVAREGNEKVVSLLLKNGANIEEGEKSVGTPLHLAASENNYNIVKILLENGANVNALDKNGDTPLHRCVKELGHIGVESVQLLLKNGANIEATNNNSETPLIRAVVSLHEDIAIKLLEYGANAEVMDKNLSNLLHLTASNGLSKVLKILLGKGLDINAKDINLMAPLHLATDHSQLENVRLLLEVGANIEVQDGMGSTPLLRTAGMIMGGEGDLNGFDHEGVLKLLLEKGANIEAADRFAITSLYMAVIRDKAYLVTELLFNSLKPANIYVTNTFNGMSPFRMARASISTLQEIKEIFNLHASLLKCIPLIPTPWSVDKLDNSTSPSFYSLHPDMVLKIAVMRLQNMFEMKDSKKAEKLIVEITHKRNMGVLKVLMQFMAEQIVDSKNTKGRKRAIDESIEDDVKTVYQQLSHYSQDFYFFSRIQRERFVKEISGKDFSDESIEEVIEEVEKDNNDKMVTYLNCFTNWQTPTTPQA